MKVLFIICFTLLSCFGALASEKLILMDVKDDLFTPDKIEALTSDSIVLVITNKGKDSEEFESTDLNKEKLILPGKTVKIKLGKLRPGVYKFVGEYFSPSPTGQITVK